MISERYISQTHLILEARSLGEGVGQWRMAARHGDTVGRKWAARLPAERSYRAQGRATYLPALN